MKRERKNNIAGVVKWGMEWFVMNTIPAVESVKSAQR
jgi:hypothetical protein